MHAVPAGKPRTTNEPLAIATYAWCASSIGLEARASTKVSLLSLPRLVAVVVVIVVLVCWTSRHVKTKTGPQSHQRIH